MPITGYVSHCLGLVANPLDAATTAWVNAVIANGGTVSVTRQGIVDNLILGLKSDGLFAKLDRLWLHAAENAASALTDIVADSLATAVSSPTFTTDRGYTGQDTNNPTAYIDTGYAPATNGVQFTQDSAHTSAWCTTNTGNTSASGSLFGLANTTILIDTEIQFSSSTLNVFSRTNDSPFSGTQGTPATRQGHWIGNRSGASASQLYQNGALFSSPNATSGPFTRYGASSLVILGNRIIDLSNGVFQGTAEQVAMFSIGASLSSTDATNFYNRLRTYMTAVGVS